MAYVSKTWVDRDSQYPTRRIIVHPDLTEEQVTVRRDEGIITTQGDVFDANTMNNLEARIAAGLREKQDELTAGTGIDITNNVISATGGGGASALDDLTDVDINSPTNGQALVYDAGNDVWVNGSAGGGGSSTLAGLTDVALATPTDGQALCYDAATQKWKNSDAGGAGAMVEKTATGAVVSFSDGADGLPVKELIAQVVAVQSGTGDPSPSNVRPISGWANVGVTKARKNIFDVDLIDSIDTDGNGTMRNGVIFSHAGTFTVDGTQTENAYIYGKIKSGDTYGNIIYFTSGSPTTFSKSVTIAQGEELLIYDGSSVATMVASKTRLSVVQIEVGSASAFEPYNATTVTIALGQTVYGGELDVTSGVLKITHGYGVFSGSDVVTVGTSSLGARYAKMPILSDAKSSGNIISSHYKNSNDASHDNSIRLAGVVVYIYDNRFVDLETAQAEVSGVQYCYELAQPVTVQLTPTEVETLLGINNIWADTGDTTVTYRTETAGQILDVVQENTGVEDLSDVSVSNVSNGQVLKYNSTSQKWENANESGGGGGAVIDDTTTSTTSVWSSSKTSSEIEATAAQILVPEFSASKSYRDDDLCLHDGKFYMAITDIPAGAWDATKWAEQTLHDVLEFYSEAAVAWADIDDLGNVQVDNLANGQVLKYNSTTQRWENANESGGGASALNDLSDVSVPSPTAGQVLTYQIAASVGEWVASSPPVPWFELTGTVPAAQDPTNPDTVSLAFRDSRITANSTVDVYTSVLGKNYVSLQVVTGRVSVSYVTGQSSFEVKVRVS